VIATLAMLAFGAAQWLRNTHEHDGRGPAALAAVAVWLLVMLVGADLLSRLARRWFRDRASRWTTAFRERRPQIFLALASLALSLIGAEAATRFWLPTPPLEWIGGATTGDAESNFCEFDPELGWRGIANRSGTIARAGSRVSVKQNSAGFRDIEHDPHSPNTSRLVLLGDSFSWGCGVEQNDVASARLRRLVPDVEVYNLGVCGYGTDQSLLNFERWADEVQPAAVCYLFFANDLTDNRSRGNHGRAKPFFTLADGRLRRERMLTTAELAADTDRSLGKKPSSPAALVRHPLLSAVWAVDYYGSPHSVLYRQFRRANLEWRRRQAPVNLDDLTAALVLEMKRQCDARDADFTFALIPDRGAMKYADGHEHYRAIREWCSANGINVLDLTPKLQASRTNPYLFEGHWTAAGHEIAAEALARQFRAATTQLGDSAKAASVR